jgi:hypothetical protein
MRTCIAITGLALALTTSLPAQQAAQADDFWEGIGRFRLTEKPKEPVDLSGRYTHSGIFPGDTTTWTSTISLKRTKTVETPQGGKINIYEIKYDAWDGLYGLVMQIGKRLYLAYGSKNIELAVAAPLVLQPAEMSAWRKTTSLYEAADKKNKGKGNAWYEVDDAPWFAGVEWNKHSVPAGTLDAAWDGTGYYAFWMEYDALWGENFYPGLKRWGAGEYRLSSFILDKGNQACGGNNCWNRGRLMITENGKNWQLREISGLGDKRDIDGTAHELPDGTVVWVIGGSESAGAGWLEVNAGGLAGTYWGWGDGRLATHRLVPDEKTLARNAAYFNAR